MEIRPISLNEKFNRISEFWSPKIIAQMNNYDFKIAKIKGEFIWHNHPNTDETFLVISGRMRIEYQGGIIDLSEGEMIVIPKGLEHKPVADQECQILMIELAGTINTGDRIDDLTQEHIDWI